MADEDKRQKLEDKVEDLDAQGAKAQEEVQQMVGEEQLRTGIDPSHEKIREDKNLPTPDPDKLPPEDGGNQLDPEEVETNETAFNKANLSDPNSPKEAAKEAKDN